MILPGLVMYWFGAELFYANSAHFVLEARKLATTGAEPVKWLVVDTSAITAIDFSAGKAVKELQQDLAKRNVTLVLARASADLRRILDQLDLTRFIGKEHIFDSRKSCLDEYRRLNGLAAFAPPLANGGQ